MSKKLLSGFLGAGAVLAVLLSGTGTAQEREHPGLTITMPADGATVAGPVTVAFSVEGGGGHRGHGGGRQVYLLIDQPAPQPGATIQADQSHIAFAEGGSQTTVTLAPGKHILQLVAVDHDGQVGRRFHAVAPVSVTVQ
jgi:hypothetical protein